MHRRVSLCVCVSYSVQEGKTPLHHACKQSNNVAVVGLLLDRGADSNAKDKVRTHTHPAHAHTPHFFLVSIVDAFCAASSTVDFVLIQRRVERLWMHRSGDWFVG